MTFDSPAQDEEGESEAGVPEGIGDEFPEMEDTHEAEAGTGDEDQFDMAGLGGLGEEPEGGGGGGVADLLGGMEGEESFPESEGVTKGMPTGLEVEPGKIEILLDLSLPVSIELGRTKMLIKDILELGHGSVIEFDKLAGEPVDLLIYDKKVAEGEVVVIDEHFGIRLTNIIKTSERLKNLGGQK